MSEHVLREYDESMGPLHPAGALSNNSSTEARSSGWIALSTMVRRDTRDKLEKYCMMNDRNLHDFLDDLICGALR